MSLPLDREARRVLPDEAAVHRHDRSVWTLRQARDRAAAAVPDFEALRDQAAAIKAHTLDHLGRYLEEFERHAAERGARVHWARDADAHNRIVHGLLAERGVRRVVKSKSMLTEECGLNRHLEARGIEVTDTDLGERIVQLYAEPPSHIVVPAIHRTRSEIGRLFEREMGAPSGESDPARLVEIARGNLRPRFLEAEAGITGVNFAIAETGSLTIVTNEGNADLGTSLPPLHIACMGIDKVLPTLEDLAVLLRLLARSATGQPLSVYTTLLTGPREGAEQHVVLVDNGRSRLLADSRHASVLACIRCGACMNTCPVYRRAGGHAYGFTPPGPLGAVLAPALAPTRATETLPFASSLCGSCSAVCPVRIDLHSQLLAWRGERTAIRGVGRLGVRSAAWVLSHPLALEAAGRLARGLWPLWSLRLPGNPLSAWLASRDLPERPRESFRRGWRRDRGRHR
ncbi:MAG: lactate utilization protein B [Myxococcota bacterium]